MTTNSTVVDSNATIHIFEAAGLGKGPFKLLRVTAEGGHCEYCNTGIVFRFYIRGIDGKEFFVGSDCVMKTDDTGLMKVVKIEVKKREAELRKKRETEKMNLLISRLADPAVIAELSKINHPSVYYANQGKTMMDYVNFVMRVGGKTAKLQLLKQIPVVNNIEAGEV